jgi:hypothetical protein
MGISSDAGNPEGPVGLIGAGCRGDAARPAVIDSDGFASGWDIESGTGRVLRGDDHAKFQPIVTLKARRCTSTNVSASQRDDRLKLFANSVHPRPGAPGSRARRGCAGCMRACV